MRFTVVAKELNGLCDGIVEVVEAVEGALASIEFAGNAVDDDDDDDDDDSELSLVRFPLVLPVSFLLLLPSAPMQETDEEVPTT